VKYGATSSVGCLPIILSSFPANLSFYGRTRTYSGITFDQAVEIYANEFEALSERSRIPQAFRSNWPDRQKLLSDVTRLPAMYADGTSSHHLL